MNIPCPISSPCLDNANPVINLSSETPDVNLFFAYGSAPGTYSQVPGGVSPDPGQNIQPDCNSNTGPAVYASPVSLEDARLGVIRGQNSCQNPPGNPTNPPTTPPGAPAFYNTVQECSVICPDGSPFTYQVAAGLFVADSQLLADRQAASYACTLANANKVCFGNLSVTATCFDSPYTGNVSITGRGPFSFSVVGGSLPNGLSLGSAGNIAIISGTPTQVGNFSFTLRGVNGVGNFMTKTFSITVLGITSGALPDFTVGTPYSFQFTAGGGTSPYSFSVVNAPLPDGLTLTTDGLLSGTPTSAASATFTVSVQDAIGLLCFQDFTMKATAVQTLIYYKMDEVAGIRESSGIAADLSPQVGGVSGVPGLILDAGSFNGPFDGNPYLKTTVTAPFVANTSFSIQAWIKFPVVGGADFPKKCIVLSAFDDAGFGPWYMYVIIDGGPPPGAIAHFVTVDSMGGQGDTLFSNDESLLPAAAWNQLAATFDVITGNLNLYINGVAVAGGVVTDFNQTPTQFKVGGGNVLPFFEGNEGVFMGQIDEVGYWQRELTPAEVLTLYNGGAGLAFGSPGFPT